MSGSGAHIALKEGVELEGEHDTYSVLERVAGGGFGEVYKGRRRGDGQLVALKLLHRLDPRSQERFRQEYELLSGFSHPYIVDAYDFGSASADAGGDSQFMVLEWLEGETLAEVVDSRGPLPPMVAIAYVLMALDGLSHAHQIPVVHKDLKPANIMVVERDGASVVKIVDFGIASIKLASGSETTVEVQGSGGYRRFTTRSMPHSAPYVAPEYLAGVDESLSPRVDVYQMGLILAELLGGEPIYQGKTAFEIYGKLLNDAHVPALPEIVNGTDLAPVILKAIAKDPLARYESAGVFGDAIRAATWSFRPQWQQIKTLSARYRRERTPTLLEEAAALASTVDLGERVVELWAADTVDDIMRANLARVLHVQLGRPADAEQLYRQVLTSGDQRIPTAVEGLAELLEAEGDVEGLHQHLTGVAVSSEDWRRVADLAEQLEDTDAIVAARKEVHSREGGEASAYALSGALLDAGDEPGAFAVLSALEEESWTPRVTRRMAVLAKAGAPQARSTGPAPAPQEEGAIEDDFASVKAGPGRLAVALVAGVVIVALVGVGYVLYSGEEKPEAPVATRVLDNTSEKSPPATAEVALDAGAETDAASDASDGADDEVAAADVAAPPKAGASRRRSRARGKLGAHFPDVGKSSAFGHIAGDQVGGGGGGFGVGGGGVGGGGGGGGANASKGQLKSTKKTASVTAGNPDIRGSLSKEIIRRVVRQHRREVTHCYESELKKNKALAGKVVVQFTISPPGRVLAAAVRSSTLKNAKVEGCITRVVRRWKFPPPKNGGVVVVSYPFTFSSK